MCKLHVSLLYFFSKAHVWTNKYKAPIKMAKQIVKFTKNFALKFKVWNQHLIYFHIGKVPYCGFSVIEIFLSKHVFFFWKLKILKKLQLHVWLAILQADIMYPSVQFFRVLLPNEVISNAWSELGSLWQAKQEVAQLQLCSKATNMVTGN